MQNERKRERFKIGLAVVLLFLGAVCFLLPGARFSARLCIILGSMSLLSIFLGRLALKYKAAKVCKVVYRVGIAALLAVLIPLEGYVIACGQQKPSDEPVDAVIVLGAGVNGETPSLALQTRIDRAAEYLRQHQDVPVVLSGGQGPGETITEALAMYRGLTALGVDGNRLLLEERSRNTKENLIYSMEILESEAGFQSDGGTVAIVTNDFHMARTRVISGKLSTVKVVGVSAKLPWWWLNVNYYVREAFAMVKTLIFN